MIKKLLKVIDDKCEHIVAETEAHIAEMAKEMGLKN